MKTLKRSKKRFRLSIRHFKDNCQKTMFAYQLISINIAVKNSIYSLEL